MTTVCLAPRSVRGLQKALTDSLHKLSSRGRSPTAGPASGGDASQILAEAWQALVDGIAPGGLRALGADESVEGFDDFKQAAFEEPMQLFLAESQGSEVAAMNRQSSNLTM